MIKFGTFHLFLIWIEIPCLFSNLWFIKNIARPCHDFRSCICAFLWILLYLLLLTISQTPKRLSCVVFDWAHPRINYSAGAATSFNYCPLPDCYLSVPCPSSFCCLLYMLLGQQVDNSIHVMLCPSFSYLCLRQHPFPLSLSWLHTTPWPDRWTRSWLSLGISSLPSPSVKLYILSRHCRACG